MKKLKLIQIKIIQYLYNMHSPFSAIELADAFNCHYNTIYYILKINNISQINDVNDLSDKQIISQINDVNDLSDKQIISQINDVNLNTLNKNDFERLQKFIAVYYKTLDPLNEDIDIQAETLKLINNIPIYLDKNINIIKTIIKQLIDDKLSLDQFNKLYLHYILNQYNTTENRLKLEYVFKSNNQYLKYFNISLEQIKDIPLRDNLELDVNIIIKTLDTLIEINNNDLKSFSIQYVKAFVAKNILNKYKKF